eukprot:31346-Pelagococcus_subviridis.AAC.25
MWTRDGRETSSRSMTPSPRLLNLARLRAYCTRTFEGRHQYARRRGSNGDRSSNASNIARSYELFPSLFSVRFRPFLLFFSRFSLRSASTSSHALLNRSATETPSASSAKPRRQRNAAAPSPSPRFDGAAPPSSSFIPPEKNIIASVDAAASPRQPLRAEASRHASAGASSGVVGSASRGGGAPRAAAAEIHHGRPRVAARLDDADATTTNPSLFSPLPNPIPRGFGRGRGRGRGHGHETPPPSTGAEAAFPTATQPSPSTARNRGDVATAAAARYASFDGATIRIRGHSARISSLCATSTSGQTSHWRDDARAVVRVSVADDDAAGGGDAAAARSSHDSTW